MLTQQEIISFFMERGYQSQWGSSICLYKSPGGTSEIAWIVFEPEGAISACVIAYTNVMQVMPCSYLGNWRIDPVDSMDRLLEIALEIENTMSNAISC